MKLLRLALTSFKRLATIISFGLFSVIFVFTGCASSLDNESPPTALTGNESRAASSESVEADTSERTPSTSPLPSPSQSLVAPAKKPLTRVSNRIKMGTLSETSFTSIAYSEAFSAVWQTLGESSRMDPYSNGLNGVTVPSKRTEASEFNDLAIKGFKQEGFPNLYHITAVQGGKELYLVSSRDDAIVAGGNVLIFDVGRRESAGLPYIAVASGGTPVYNAKNSLYYYPQFCEVLTIDTQTRRGGKRIDTSCTISSLFLTSDGGELLVGLESGSIKIYDAITFAPVRTVQARERFKPFATTDANNIILGHDGLEIVKINAETGEELQVVDSCENIYDAVASPEVEFVYVTCYEGSIAIYEAKTLTLVSRIPIKGRVGEIVLNEDGSMGFVVANTRLLILSQ